MCTRRLRTPPTFLSLRRASCAWQTPHAKSTQLRTMSTKERKFKAGLDKDDCRKNRADQKVQLRKASKEEGNMKRRNMTAVSAEIVVEEEASGDGPGVPELPESGASKPSCAESCPFVGRTRRRRGGRLSSWVRADLYLWARTMRVFPKRLWAQGI